MLEAFIILAVVVAVLAGVVFYMGPETFLKKIFGTKHDREVKALAPIIAAINEMEPRMMALSDAELAAQTVAFREQLAQGATLDDLLVPAFAAVREAGRRYVNMRRETRSGSVTRRT